MCVCGICIYICTMYICMCCVCVCTYVCVKGHASLWFTWDGARHCIVQLVFDRAWGLPALPSTRRRR